MRTIAILSIPLPTISAQCIVLPPIQYSALVSLFDTLPPRKAQTKKSGIVILGGSLPKHHTCNANLMRNGADFAVFINTGSDFDGSDSGARPDEALSWGKIKLTATPVKIYADATLIFPLLVAQTFAKRVEAEKAAAAERALRDATAGGSVGATPAS